MNEQQRHDLFSELIVRHQSELYAYLFAIARNWEDTDDLYQTVCLVLWSKFDSFRPGTSFFAWARQTAKLTARNHLKQKHSRAFVSDKLLDVFAETAASDQGQWSDPSYMAALERCRSKLNDADNDLLGLRYIENLSSGKIADQLHRPQQSVCQSLKRIRRWLLECVQKELSQEKHPR